MSDLAPPSESAQWHRMHPITPLVKGWKFSAVGVAVLVQRTENGLFSGQGPTKTEILFGLLALLGLVVIACFGAFLAWRAARYRISDRMLELRTGVIFRSERQARLDRLQAVDIVRPLIGRFFGLAQLRVEVAGGTKSDVTLELLTEAKAESLRAELLARSAGISPAAERADERALLAVPIGRLLGSIALTGQTLFLVVMPLFGIGLAVALSSWQPLLLLWPALLGIGLITWNMFSEGFGFRVAIAADGLRIRGGLLTTRSQTVPPGRVQAIRCQQPFWWRRHGWWRLTMNVAGYSLGSSGGQLVPQSSTLLCVGTWAETQQILALAFPQAFSDTAQAELTAALSGGFEQDSGYTGPPRKARWLDPLGWRWQGFYVTEAVLILRRGVFKRELDLVPHARTQSLSVHQGPVQRKLGLASFAVQSTVGPVAPKVAHLSAATAQQLLADQADRAAHFRRLRGDQDQGVWLGEAGAAGTD